MKVMMELLLQDGMQKKHDTMSYFALTQKINERNDGTASAGRDGIVSRPIKDS